MEQKKNQQGDENVSGLLTSMCLSPTWTITNRNARPSQSRGDVSAQNQAPSNTSRATKMTCKPSARSSEGESAAGTGKLSKHRGQRPALALSQTGGHRSALAGISPGVLV